MAYPVCIGCQLKPIFRHHRVRVSAEWKGMGMKLFRRIRLVILSVGISAAGILPFTVPLAVPLALPLAAQTPPPQTPPAQPPPVRRAKR